MSVKQLATETKCSVGLFCIGGGVYNLIEIFWRGYTHWSMFLVGGTCFHLIGKIGSLFRTWNMARKCALCSLAVTAVEYVSGCLFNLRLKLNVWDYSEMPFNLNGQVCLLYTVLWGFLSATAMPLYRFFRRRLETGRFFPVTSALKS